MLAGEKTPENMELSMEPTFIEHYVNRLVKYLDEVDYHEPSPAQTRELRSNYEAVYENSLRVFAQPSVQQLLSLDLGTTKKVTRTISRMAVTCWPNVPLEVMKAIAIHFSMCHLLDDFEGDYHEQMATFLPDLLRGTEQKNPCWRMLVDEMQNLLRHFDSYLQYGIFRATIDYYQSCWTEAHGFQGDKGCDRYPVELRRQGGLGGCMGSFMFPRSMVSQNGMIADITSAVVHTEWCGIYINDLFSFYKESVAANRYGPWDNINLVMNLCHVRGLSMKDGFDQIVVDAIHTVQKTREVFDGSHAAVAECGVHAFLHGYTQWHFCDGRYRMRELYEQSYDFVNGGRFREYCEKAWEAGGVDLDQAMFADVEKRVWDGRRANGSL
ncbi:Trichodiene synthase [Penicillium capsulatum]|uniref:Trichodiene synthase n=1 Tax=Penicillium capsulatum TaxID=69766 RepID=A0A9W9LEP9_9EURO|nr:Trichodiene synthase [Penicillium capsulatum]KAJ6112687.1 Trichodiene synthase [Penicillium capsulatum]